MHQQLTGLFMFTHPVLYYDERNWGPADSTKKNSILGYEEG